MSNKIPYVAGRSSLMFSDNGVGKVVPKNHFNYVDIIAALNAGDEDRVRALLVPVKEAMLASFDGMLSLDNGKFVFDGKPLHHALSTRLLSLKRDGHDITPLVNVFRNLLDNPSKRAVDELYGFLEVCDLPVTPDGHFIAYKMIRADYTDLYTGTMDNSVGATPSMRRNEVCDEKERTCSQGLHFASLHYVLHGSYGSRDRGNRLVAVKINPADVVSIPVDYNNSKGRACKYTIIKELDWSERLPINSTGFKFLDEDSPDGTATVGGKAVADEIKPVSDEYDSAVIITPNGIRKWTDAEIAEVKYMVAPVSAGGLGMGLTAIQAETGMSRRQVARIRDGEVGGNLPMATVHNVLNWGVPKQD